MRERLRVQLERAAALEDELAIANEQVGHFTQIAIVFRSYNWCSHCDVNKSSV